MKKIFLIILTVALLATLAACGENGNSETSVVSGDNSSAVTSQTTSVPSEISQPNETSVVTESSVSEESSEITNPSGDTQTDWKALETKIGYTTGVSSARLVFTKVHDLPVSYITSLGEYCAINDGSVTRIFKYDGAFVYTAFGKAEYCEKCGYIYFGGNKTKGYSFAETAPDPADENNNPVFTAEIHGDVACAHTESVPTFTFTNGTLNYSQNGQSGVYDGDMSVPAVDESGKYGVVDKNGSVIVPFEYDYISLFNNGVAVAQKSGSATYFNTSGNEIKTPAVVGGALYNGKAWIFDGTKCYVYKFS